MNSNKYVHTKIVPRLYTALWTIALALGGVAIFIKRLQENQNEALLYAIFLVFLVFLFESAVMFLDIRALYEKKTFKGNIFGVNFRMFIIIPLIFIFGILFLYSGIYGLFVITILGMGLLKYEIVMFEKNIESYMVDVRPTFTPNKLK